MNTESSCPAQSNCRLTKPTDGLDNLAVIPAIARTLPATDTELER